MLENLSASSAIDQNDEFIFAQEDEEINPGEKTEQNTSENSWKILIVDDDVEVHNVTKLALSDFTFEGKPLTFISAYSAQEANQLIQSHPDTAIMFLDVVMETENAGLQVVQFVRDELENHLVRIILRTGQPGQAPENVVAVNYGIDDYKTKTELTSQKLSITVVTALRAFSTLMTMLESSRSLELELIQHKQAEAALRFSEMREREKVQQLEQSLQALQQVQAQLGQREKIETLGQLVAEVTHEIMSAPSQTGTLYTISMITRIARMVLRITDEHSAKLGLSQSKLAVLMYLSSEPELCASPSALAKQCGVSRAAMTGLLDGLEQEAYVERDSHPSDRRALMVKLTPKGQQFLDWISPQDQYQLSELMSNLDDTERQKLIDLAMTMIKLAEDQTADPSDG
jgi:DNA-binding MarR family transcriptional regulator/CheY-like chemotaxis protein